uniref:BLOC-2 complex member HPS6 n=1 Tax=Euleptes europaea TaxID=460621 RepID=UPI0025416052|nr:BLOC-2 complex member HPS6 [Euleptes europaea]
MKRAAALRQVSDWSDLARGRRLRELLGARRPGRAARRVVSSPDGRHLLLLLLLRDPPAGPARVVALQRLGPGGGGLERSWEPPQLPVAGLLFVQSGAGPAPWALAIVGEQGRTELWRFVPAAGWRLLQSLELCCGARARVVSICSRGSRLVWCEERPPLNTPLTPEKGAFRYCICTGDLQVGEDGARLSPLRVVLHNSPAYQVLAASSGVFLVPTPATFSGVAKCVLIWRPENTDIVVAAPSRGCICTEVLHPGREVDYKKLILGYVGILASMAILDIRGCSLSSSKGLLLVTSSGTVDLVQSNGLWRPVFDFGESALAPGEEVQLKVFGDTLACLLGGVLYLVDLNSGQLLEKKLLSTEMLFLDFHGEEEEAAVVQLLAPDGIYHLDFSGTDKDSQPEPTLVEVVFEEACKYYQRRSLSSSQLTVEKLKKGGMFQAPVALSAILCHSLASKDKRTGALPEPYAKLLSTMQLELQSYQNLEFLKSCVVGASESEVDSYGEELVEQELNRLVRLDLNRENLAYMNAIFSSFPVASWKAIQNHLQLQQNGEGLLIARATPDVWKKILGGPVPGLCKQEASLNGVVPLFELICLSLYQFKPKWLPRFVELSQQYVGTSWAYKEGPEGGVPLYKRALAVLTRKGSCSVAYPEMEIELLLCSQRPKAILQALDLLIRHRRWQRVMDAAEKFSRLSPLLNKEIFIVLLGEFAQHRALDPYLDTLWELCPADLSASDILSIIQQHLPQTELDHPPFLPGGSPQLTVGLLKPLLHRLARCSAGQDEIYADVLQGPGFPPPTPPRQHRVAPKTAAAQEEHVQRTEPFHNHTQGTLFEGV